MLHDTANKIIGFFTQAHFSIRIVENIMSVFGQGHIDMHSGTINPVFRLRHKACKQTVPLGNCLNRQFECHDIICRLQCLIILKVNLMLCGCYLMVGSFDLISSSVSTISRLAFSPRSTGPRSKYPAFSWESVVGWPFSS